MEMILETRSIKREDILSLAHQARLTIVDGNFACLNDLATDKELIRFARLIEAKLRGAGKNVPARKEAAMKGNEELLAA